MFQTRLPGQNCARCSSSPMGWVGQLQLDSPLKRSRRSSRQPGRQPRMKRSARGSRMQCPRSTRPYGRPPRGNLECGGMGTTIVVAVHSSDVIETPEQARHA